MHHESCLPRPGKPWKSLNLSTLGELDGISCPIGCPNDSEIAELTTGIAPRRLRGVRRQAETHCIILFRLDPQQEMPWQRQHTKNSKQNSRKWKSREARAAAARWSFASVKKGASACTGWDAFPSRFITNNGPGCWRRYRNCARSSKKTRLRAS